MRRTAISVFTLTVALACAACGSSDDGQDAPAAGSSASAAPASPAAKPCDQQTWPQPLPDFRGKQLGETVVGAGLCFAIGSITATDGRDVMNDPSSHTVPWTITEQTPAAGTAVSPDTPVTLKVSAAQ
ncbi:PASTA domain-containing protein [Nocardia wallacei]|uniref:PASTA domain-containing protein n=1 Tax=Nocardia wallacei TaxID=480035 RepID=UPI0024540B27|nr:PASTA domain-containing protein [Nocardia wallacei]